MSNWKFLDRLRLEVSARSFNIANGQCISDDCEETAIKYAREIGVIEGLQLAAKISDDIEAGRDAA